VWELVTFLDRCRFPSTAPKIALFDLNPHSLAKSAKRLRRYNPSCYMGNALQRIDIGMSGFDSISLNYLLHCLPGNLASKSIVFENVNPLLRDGGLIFGSTILGEGGLPIDSERERSAIAEAGRCAAPLRRFPGIGCNTQRSHFRLCVNHAGR
jgi:hypothetical protein